MSCEQNKFTITKGMVNTFMFTIKADGVSAPMAIASGDTFRGVLRKLSDNSVAVSKALSVVNASSGKVSLTLTEQECESLISEYGGKADRYYTKPTYKLLLECDTQANGKFIAKVPEVHVD